MQTFLGLRRLVELSQKKKSGGITEKDAEEVFTERLGFTGFQQQWKSYDAYTNYDDYNKKTPTSKPLLEALAVWYFNKAQHTQVYDARRSALLIIDIQYDFCPPTGSLAVNDGVAVIPVINHLRRSRQWHTIALTQDWHPQNHISFQINHKEDPKAQLFTPYTLSNGHVQVLWPAHCVQGSDGAKFHNQLIRENTDHIVQKGMCVEVDSYSGFYDNDHKTASQLAPILKKHRITDVFVAGLAYDYCVGYSALDAHSEGFRTFVVEDGTRGVAPESTKDMIKKLGEKNIKIIKSSEVPENGLFPLEK